MTTRTDDVQHQRESLPAGTGPAPDATPSAIPAVGYVHSDDGDIAALSAAAGQLRACGSRLGFDVRAVFRETMVNRWGRADAFMAVLDEVRVRRARAVLVLNPAHLSPLPDVRRWMADMIATAGALLVVLDPDAPAPSTGRTVVGPSVAPPRRTETRT